MRRLLLVAVVLGVGILPAPPARVGAWRTGAAAPAPSAPAPRRALLVGDGVLYDAAPAIQAALVAAGSAVVTAAPTFGLGLTRPEWRDWRTDWPALVARDRPDLVVLFVGPWDLRAIATDRGRLEPGDASWARWYRGLADRAVTILTAGGARLVWVGATLEGGAGTAPRVRALNDVVRAVAGSHRGAVAFVDGAGLLAGPGGAFAAVQTTPGGEAVRLMKPDGEHLCPAGAARLASGVVAAGEQWWALRPAPDWVDGPWRSDGRYSWAPGGGCPSP